MNEEFENWFNSEYPLKNKESSQSLATRIFAKEAAFKAWIKALQSQWQPIETAPKNLEFRCLLGHKISVVTGYWDGNGWINERSKMESGQNYFPATHWQPLPPLP